MARDEAVEVGVEGMILAGHLMVPDDPLGLVVFAHGSGSSRHSPRNRYVADILNEAGLGTLLFDLLTPAEEIDRRNVFDVEMLGARLGRVTAWARAEVGDLPVGYFGASTGAGAALVAAATPDLDVSAVVSRGGRPDLAWPHLDSVDAPTLLIVGGNDPAVLDLNRQAIERMVCPTRLDIVPGASHLFEEPGTLEAVASLAQEWFVEYLL